MWNPLHYAIFYRQVKAVEYFVKDLDINLKVAFEVPFTKNEFGDDEQMLDLLQGCDDLFGFLLSIYARDIPMLLFLYEHLFDFL
jgi:ankyrin repeat protein